MIVGPKYKICKRLGSHVFEKCQTKQYSVAEQRIRTDKKKRRTGSDFNRQLIEKQKLRLIYSLTERQFSTYVFEALESGQNPSQYLFGKLESRLDSTIYRTGLAKTRRGARQLASHGHVLVNGKRVTVPSYALSVGDVLEVRGASKESGLFQGREEQIKEHQPPTWIAFDADKQTATFQSLPTWGSQDSIVDFGAVFEYYTR